MAIEKEEVERRLQGAEKMLEESRHRAVELAESREAEVAKTRTNMLEHSKLESSTRALKLEKETVERTMRRIRKEFSDSEGQVRALQSEQDALQGQVRELRSTCDDSKMQLQR